jgi:hypothetical protein
MAPMEQQPEQWQQEARTTARTWQPAAAKASKLMAPSQAKLGTKSAQQARLRWQNSGHKQESLSLPRFWGCQVEYLELAEL